MTKKDKEVEILIKILDTDPVNEGGYRLIEYLHVIIARVMGYEHEVEYEEGPYRSKRPVVKSPEVLRKTQMVINGMEKKGVIKLSKNKLCFKLPKERILEVEEDRWVYEYSDEAFTYKACR